MTNPPSNLMVTWRQRAKVEAAFSAMKRSGPQVDPPQPGPIGKVQRKLSLTAGHVMVALDVSLAVAIALEYAPLSAREALPLVGRLQSYAALNPEIALTASTGHFSDVSPRTPTCRGKRRNSATGGSARG